MRVGIRGLGIVLPKEINRLASIQTLVRGLRCDPGAIRASAARRFLTRFSAPSQRRCKRVLNGPAAGAKSLGARIG
jgi:hypothetical protein